MVMNQYIITTVSKEKRNVSIKTLNGDTSVTFKNFLKWKIPPHKNP